MLKSEYLVPGQPAQGGVGGLDAGILHQLVGIQGHGGTFSASLVRAAVMGEATMQRG